MTKLALVGDSHGNYDQYLDICSNYDYTLQVGDMGYSYTPLSYLDPNKHKFIAGNHEDHKTCYSVPHCLGRFGYTRLNGIDLFFVSGAFSVDGKIRTEKFLSGEWPQTHFDNEELSESEIIECEALYREVKPDILITHEAPRRTVGDFTNPFILKQFGFNHYTFSTRTSDFLDKLWDIHRPSFHACGHYHKNFYKMYGNTHFFVLKELGVLEI